MVACCPEVAQLITSNLKIPKAILTHSHTKGGPSSIGIPDGIEILDPDEDPSTKVWTTDEDILISEPIQTKDDFL